MRVIKIFKKISTIPHCSGHTRNLQDFIVDFCKKAGCEVNSDAYGNIVATKGNPSVCLQAHYDMVCVGDAPKIKVMEKDGYLVAKNSSLGSDNGVGVAMMLDVIRKKDDVELLFTNDEEIGMIGATGLSLKIKSKSILNLDMEIEDKVCIGCAGGIEAKVKKRYEKDILDDKYELYMLSVDDLPGGHSGMDIDKNIPNAIKELCFYLSEFYPLVVSINGGEAMNSIPRAAQAVIAVKKSFCFPKNNLIKIKKLDKKFYKKYLKNSKEIIDMVCGFHSGVREYDKKLHLVETSINLSKIKTEKDTVFVELFPRANRNKALKRIKKEIESYFSNLKYNIKFSHYYDAWEHNESAFSKKVLNLCKKEFKDASYYTMHAGLECGILLKKLGNNKMVVSIGPNILYPHSTHEKCDIRSIKKVYKIVKKLL